MIKTILGIVPSFAAQYSNQMNSNIYVNQASILKHFIQLTGTHYLIYYNPMAHQLPTNIMLQYLTKGILLNKVFVNKSAVICLQCLSMRKEFGCWLCSFWYRIQLQNKFLNLQLCCKLQSLSLALLSRHLSFFSNNSA